MSYGILYDKQFVKLTDGRIIPMMLAGDNNCYEHGGKRARSWANGTYWTGGKLAATPAEMLRKVEEEIQGYIDRCGTDEWYKKNGYTAELVRKEYGYFAALVVGSGSCSGTSAAAYVGFVRSGIKNAKTVEELAAQCTPLTFRAWKGYNEQWSTPPPDSRPLKTETDLLAAVEAFTAWQESTRMIEDEKQTDRKPYMPVLTFDGSWEYIQNLLKRIRSAAVRKETVTEEVQGYYVLQNHAGTLARYGSRGYKYAYSEQSSSVKKFRSEVEAEKYRLSLIERKKYHAETWTVKKVEGLGVFRIVKRIQLHKPEEVPA